MLESLLFALTVCLDSFITSFSYGVSKIKIPFVNCIVLNVIGTAIITFSLIIGFFLKTYIKTSILPLVCFLFLFIIGLIRLFDGLIKNYIQKKGSIENEVNFSFLNLKFILKVYSSPLLADQDKSKTLSLKETISLGLALSLDGMLIGFGAALTSVSYLQVILFTFVIGLFLTILGHLLGTKIGKKIKTDLSFIGGILLLFLAFSKL